MSLYFPPLPSTPPEWPQLQLWWQQEAEQLSARMDTIADMLNDNVLTIDKKSVWIMMYDFITSEQASLDAQATALGITTEKTAYDSAITALTSYLATVNSPVAWNDLTDKTTIDGPTFRQKFTDVLTAKQTLLNKLDNVASTLSTWAGVSGTGKPQDNATLGANLATNVTNVAPQYLPPISIANLSYTFTGAISYSSTTTTATISVAAGSLIIGSTSVSYNAMSTNITGATPGTTVTYFLYVSSGGFTAGAHTLQKTTTGSTVYSNDNNIYIGSVDVIFPASGTSSGTGTGGGGACVAADSLILMADGSAKPALMVRPGDVVRTRHELSGRWGAFPVVAASFVEAPIVSRRGWPDATPNHRFGLCWMPECLRWFPARLIGRKSGTALVAKFTIGEAHTYMARHPASRTWRWCHNTKPY